MVNKKEGALTLGILHPGEMGVSIAASAQNSGHTVWWVGAGRSAQTAARAAQVGLHDAGSLASLCTQCAMIFSVCPPDAAEALAEQVAAQGFRGVYVDMNAISPQRAERIAAIIMAGGAAFVDGGIIGGPAWQPDSTWLYLSGADAPAVAACFAAGPLATRVLGEEIGRASALKMCFAAYSKGSTALLCAALAAAQSLDVRDELQALWSQDGPNVQRMSGAARKAWRFVGEMDEISATFAAAGVPGEFHAAAAEIYRRMAAFKDAAPDLDAILAALLERGGR